MPVKRLPSNPNLNHLRYQAKDLLRDHAARKPEIAQRLREFHPGFSQATDVEIFAAKLTLSDAQMAIARESGFPGWARLKRHIEKRTVSDQLNLPHHERIEDSVFRRAVELLDAGDVEGLRTHLQRHPNLTHQRVVFEGGNYFRNPTLLQFVAENPVRHGTLPKNIVRIAKVILDTGVGQAELNETLMLVATGSVPRECGMQHDLIDLLCEYGADPNSALIAAILHGEMAAVRVLLGRGAQMKLPVAAALGQIENVRKLLPGTDAHDRHLALALASQFGQVEIVRLLLDAGEDPNRYNPVGGHSHSTPMHQAAAAGNKELVQLLLEHGARLDLKDILWRATPADWAKHEGHPELETYLRAQATENKKPG
jgi:hypothetical protein